MRDHLFLKVIGGNLILLAIGLFLETHEAVRILAFMAWSGLVLLFLAAKTRSRYILVSIGFLFLFAWLFDRDTNHEIAFWGFFALIGIAILAWDLLPAIRARINKK